MIEVESAGEFAKVLLKPPSDCDAAVVTGLLIESRDTAIREAAKLEGKRELFREFRAAVAEYAGHRGCARGYEYHQALVLLELKYAPADATQPIQPTKGEKL
jgi:hypothetical protein